jgi:putative N6-adenine-specific DNA methylase
MKKFDLIATATFGLESVVARELKELGYTDLIVENSRVIFKGTYEDICRTNLWLRTADRILVRVGEFEATSFEALFEKTKALPWEDWLPEDAEFPVEGKSIKSKLFSVPDCQAIVKKAIVERMKQKYKTTWFEETGPKFKLEVALLKDIATLTIDTTGPGLHKRGYRSLSSKAPLKETLAAALVQLSYWNKDRILVDPCCGSGTILIEAAMIGLNIAPGLKREFISETWPCISEKLWTKVRQDAQASIDTTTQLQIFGSDIDKEVLSLTRYHIKQAGLEGHIFVQAMPLNEFKSKKKYGCIITNPPYGERLLDQEKAEKLYKEMKVTFKPLDTWSVYVITSNKSFEKLYGKKADRRRKLYNGTIECCYYQYYGPRPPRRENDEVNDEVSSNEE